MHQSFGFVKVVSKAVFRCVLVSLAATLVAEVQATATLRISADNGLTWTNVVDNGPFHSDTNIGSILYNGASTPFRGVFVGSSQHRVDVPSYLDLNCSVISAATPLIFQYSDDGFGPFMGTFASSIGGTGTAPLNWKTFMDPANQLFGGTNLANAAATTGEFAWISNSAPMSVSLYSLTSEVRLAAAGGGTTFDLLLEAYAPAAPVLYPTITNGAINLSFETEAGFAYVLERKINLGGGDWVPLQTVEGNDSMVTLVDSLVGGQAKFYRVRVH